MVSDDVKNLVDISVPMLDISKERISQVSVQYRGITGRNLPVKYSS